MEIYDIPSSVLNMSFEEVLEMAFAEIDSIDLNPVELIFACIFLHNGWRVVRTPMSKDNPVHQSTSVAIERATGVHDALYGSGVPDFFLWDRDGNLRFVEIKASENSLNAHQQEWAEEYDWNLMIAQLAPEDSTKDEVIEENSLL